MSPEPTPFEKLLVALARGRVDFAVVGGVACALNGFVRATEDVDILVARDPANVERLLQVLRNFGQGHARELSPADFSDEEGAIRVIEEFPLDIFVRMGGCHLEDIREHILQSRIAGALIPFLSAQGLIHLKGSSVREKDRIDVEALRRILSQRSDGAPP